MANIGSVFLGDVQRSRVLSGSSATSTPPSSPPPIPGIPGSASNMSGVLANLSRSGSPASTPSSPPPTSGLKGASGRSMSVSSLSGLGRGQQQSQPQQQQKPAAQPPVVIDTALALELRVRWLEAILFGVKPEVRGGAGVGVGGVAGNKRAKGPVGVGKGKGREREKMADPKPGETLTRLAEDIQRRLDAAVEGNEGLKKFMDHYDRNAHLLTASFALSGLLPDAPSYDHLSPEEVNALLAEMEPDIRAADRDMREIEALEKKGVTGSGKLPDYAALEPRLGALIQRHQEDVDLAASLEKRMATIMERHATQVDALSELFVVWDDAITEAENKVTRLERAGEQRRRLGLE